MSHEAPRRPRPEGVVSVAATCPDIDKLCLAVRRAARGGPLQDRLMLSLLEGLRAENMQLRKNAALWERACRDEWDKPTHG